MIEVELTALDSENPKTKDSSIPGNRLKKQASMTAGCGGWI
jgi:hypothetical protein